MPTIFFSDALVYMFFGGGKTRRRSRVHRRRPRNTHRVRKFRVGKKHTRSRTHKGRQNFVTGKRSHEYDRRGHYVKGKPYRRYRRKATRSRRHRR